MVLISRLTIGCEVQRDQNFWKFGIYRHVLRRVEVIYIYIVLPQVYRPHEPLGTSSLDIFGPPEVALGQMPVIITP